MSTPVVANDRQARIVAKMLKEGKVDPSKRESAIAALRDFANKGSAPKTEVKKETEGARFDPDTFLDSKSGKTNAEGKPLGVDNRLFEDAFDPEGAGMLSGLNPFDRGHGPKGLTDTQIPSELARRLTPEGRPGAEKNKYGMEPDGSFSGIVNPILNPMRYFWNNKVMGQEARRERDAEDAKLKAETGSSERDFRGDPLVRKGAGKPMLDEDTARDIYKMMEKYSKEAEETRSRSTPILMPWDDTVGGAGGPTIRSDGKFRTSDDGARVVAGSTGGTGFGGFFSEPHASLPDFLSKVLRSPPKVWGRSAGPMGRFKAELEEYLSESPETEETTSSNLPPEAMRFLGPPISEEHAGGEIRWDDDGAMWHRPSKEDIEKRALLEQARQGNYFILH